MKHIPCINWRFSVIWTVKILTISRFVLITHHFVCLNICSCHPFFLLNFANFTWSNSLQQFDDLWLLEHILDQFIFWLFQERTLLIPWNQTPYNFSFPFYTNTLKARPNFLRAKSPYVYWLTRLASAIVKHDVVTNKATI